LHDSDNGGVYINHLYALGYKGNKHQKSDSYIIGVIPFIALLIFLVVQQQVFGEQIQFGAVIEPVLWVISVIVATLVGYLLHAVISK